MRLLVRLVYDLAEGSLCRRGRPVSSPPSHHLITGFYHREPFLRLGKHVRETASFQQKEPPLTEWPSMMGGAKGTPLVYWYSAVLSVCRNVGYLVGYLTGLFSLAFFRSRTHGVSRAFSSPFLSSVLFLCGGRGCPRIAQGFPRGRRPPGEAVACRLPFSRLFYIQFFFFRFFTFWSHSRFL